MDDIIRVGKQPIINLMFGFPVELTQKWLTQGVLQAEPDSLKPD